MEGLGEGRRESGEVDRSIGERECVCERACGGDRRILIANCLSSGLLPHVTKVVSFMGKAG